MYKLYDEKIYNEKVNEKNKDLLEDYILEMKSQKKSKGTIDQYAFDIRAFFCWLHDNAKNKFVLDCKKRVFRQFFLDCQDAGASAARINRQQCAIRTMLAFAEGDDDEYEDYENNAMRTIKGLQKEKVREIVFLEDHQITELLDELIKRERYRIAMFVALAYESAGRKNEIAQIDRSSFHTVGNETNIVIGKRAKKFRLRYYNRSKEIYEKYIKEDLVVAGPLFYNTKNEKRTPLSVDNFYPWILECRKVLEDLGYDYLLFNCHGFRHACAENLLNGTHYILPILGVDHKPLDEIQLLLHHESIEVTQGYVKNRTEEAERESFAVEL